MPGTQSLGCQHNFKSCHFNALLLVFTSPLFTLGLGLKKEFKSLYILTGFLTVIYRFSLRDQHCISAPLSKWDTRL